MNPVRSDLCEFCDECMCNPVKNPLYASCSHTYKRNTYVPSCCVHYLSTFLFQHSADFPVVIPDMWSVRCNGAHW